MPNARLEQQKREMLPFFKPISQSKLAQQAINNRIYTLFQKLAEEI